MNQIANTGDIDLRAAESKRLRFGALVLASGIVAGALIGVLGIAAYNTWQSASATGAEAPVSVADPLTAVPAHLRSERQQAPAP